MILHAWDHERMRALKAANPHVKVLAYKNMSATYSYAVEGGRDNSFLPAGVGYVAATTAHPEWFAVDTAGRRIEFADYHDLWLMDVGSEAYQQAWLDAVGAELRRYGWDGVMIDDANVSPRWHTGGRTIARYPTDAAWTAATRSFLARVGPALQRDGFLVVPNIYTEWPNGPQVWQDWLQFTSGGVQEYWTKWGTGTDRHFVHPDWTYRQQFLSLTQSLGKLYLGITYAPIADVRSQRYARASFLVDWDGGQSALVFQPTGPEAQPAFAPEWTWEIGRPAGARQKVGESVYRRDYTSGAALVNTSATDAQQVELGRSYLTPEGMPVTSLTLAPSTGIVLRLPPGAPAPPPPLSTPPVQPPAPPAPENPPAEADGPATQSQPTRPGAASAPVVTKTPKRLRPKVRVALKAGRRVSGRVVGRLGSARVSVYWRGAGRWRLLVRVRSDRRGHFVLGRALRPKRTIRLRAVARLGDQVARSRVVRVRAP